MRKIICLAVFFTLTFLPLSSFQKSADTRRDGYFWEKNNSMSKLGYIVGLREGYGQCVLFFDALSSVYSDSTKDFSCYDFLVSLYEYLSRFRYGNVTNGQLLNGLDQFYEDYRNKQIEISSACRVVALEVGGKPQTVIDSLTRELRQIHEKYR